MYAILDAIVDNYFTVIEVLGDKVEELEGFLFQSKDADDRTPGQIQQLKQEILKMRRSIYPLREVISRMEKTDFMFIEDKTHSYLRDLYDHIIQASEAIDLYREMIWGLIDMPVVECCPFYSPEESACKFLRVCSRTPFHKTFSGRWS